MLDPKASWHGFGNLAADYIMLDPIKVTLLTPGLGKGAKLAKTGIPAAVVTKYLWERGLVVEKTGLYSFLILFSLGITRGKWATMVDALVDFKTDYDRNAPLAKTLPSVRRRRPRLRRLGPARPVRRAARRATATTTPPAR